MNPPDQKRHYSEPSAAPDVPARDEGLRHFAKHLCRDLRVLAGWPCLLLLALGLGNFAGGLALGLPAAMARTRLVLDVAHANFGFLAAALVFCCSAAMPVVREAVALAARACALAVASLAAPTLAALVGMGYQWWSGYGQLQLTLYAASLYVGMGWHLLHLSALAVAMQAALAGWSERASGRFRSARRWLGAGAAVSLYAVSRAFDHALLRFGTPTWPISEVDGYADVLYWQVAIGIYWSGFCALLLAVACVVLQSGGERPLGLSLRAVRLSPNLAAIGWGGLLVWTISGAWITASTEVEAPSAGTGTAEATPQPSLSSLDIQVDIDHIARTVASQGAAVVVNRSDVPIALLRIGAPPGLTIGQIDLTGELARRHEDALHYRLNRPLEPAETLRVDFKASLALATVPTVQARAREKTQGPARPSSATFLRSSDILPAFGRAPLPSASAADGSGQGIAFRARIGTTTDRVAVAPGLLLRQWKEEGRSYFEYQARRNVPAQLYIHAARYAVVRAHWRGVAIEAYHLPWHRTTAQRLIDVAKERIDHSAWPYPWLRIVEVADYQPLAESPGLLAFGWRTGQRRPSFEPLGGVLPYSELRFPR